MPICADFRQSSDLVAASSGRSLLTAPCHRCKSIVADSQLVFGAGRGGNRSTYKIWEEGKPPDFVLEVAAAVATDRTTAAVRRLRPPRSEQESYP